MKLLQSLYEIAGTITIDTEEIFLVQTLGANEARCACYKYLFH